MTKEEFITKYSGKHYGDVKSLEQKLADIAGFVFDAIKFKGAATAAEVEILTDMINGDSYRITTGGNIDSITTSTGNVVVYNGVSNEWEFLVS